MSNEYTLNELNNIVKNVLNDNLGNIGVISTIGEINGIKKFRNNSGCSFNIKLNDDVFECRGWRSVIDVYNVEQYDLKKCKVIGNLKYNDKFGKVFIDLLQEIELIDDVSQIKTLKIECEKRGYLINKKQINWTNIKTLGIISKKETQGMLLVAQNLIFLDNIYMYMYVYIYNKKLIFISNIYNYIITLHYT